MVGWLPEKPENADVDPLVEVLSLSHIHHLSRGDVGIVVGKATRLQARRWVVKVGGARASASLAPKKLVSHAYICPYFTLFQVKVGGASGQMPPL